VAAINARYAAIITRHQTPSGEAAANADDGVQDANTAPEPPPAVPATPSTAALRSAGRHNLGELPIVNVYSARERARGGERDDAIPLMRAAAAHLFRDGQLLAWGLPATGVLVETLLDHGAEADVVEAEAAIERFAAAPADEGLVIRDIWLLRLRALLARTRGDEVGYRDFRDRYRHMAKTLGYEMHIAWVEAMP
ncbi:MAG TPA: hypothetical protein VMU34_26215, partial [Mycobacterium sp.]|nr:hypothetical protein [Mycobacterium sp.]